MALGKDYAGQDCSMARALEVVGERWTLLIVRDALYGVRRFSDYLAHLGIPRAVLSARLHALTEAGVLAKEGNEYALTPMGVELWPVVHTLARWGERHRSGEEMRIFVHAECGGRLADDATCPACDRPVRPADVEMHPGPGALRRDDPVSVYLRKPHRLLDPIHT